MQEAYRFLPFFIDDYCMFGDIDDVELFWNVPLQNASGGGRARIASKYDINTIGEVFEPCPSPEIYLYRSFAERLGDPSNLTAEDYYRFLTERLILTNWDQWFWFKYNSIPFVPRRTMESYMNYMNFRDWLALCHGREKYLFDAETVMKLSPTDRVPCFKNNKE